MAPNSIDSCQDIVSIEAYLRGTSCWTILLDNWLEVGLELAKGHRKPDVGLHTGPGSPCVSGCVGPIMKK